MNEQTINKGLMIAGGFWDWDYLAIYSLERKKKQR